MQIYRSSDEIHCLRKLSCNFVRLLQLKSLMSVSILIRFLFLTHLPLALTSICHPGSWFFFFPFCASSSVQGAVSVGGCSTSFSCLHLLLCSQMRLPSLSLALDFCVTDNGHLWEVFIRFTEGPCPFVEIAWKEVTKLYNNPLAMPRAISPIRSWCSDGVFKKCMCNN